MNIKTKCAYATESKFDSKLVFEWMSFAFWENEVEF